MFEGLTGVGEEVGNEQLAIGKIAVGKPEWLRGSVKSKRH